MNTKVVERSILHYTNRERRRRGLQRLKGHLGLIRAARGTADGWRATIATRILAAVVVNPGIEHEKPATRPEV